jgi:formate dehydrogenase subunit gamma
MPETMSESVNTHTNYNKEEMLQDDSFTHVKGVGVIPRDIYRYVKSDPLGDLPRYSIHIVIQHIMVFVSFLTLALTGLPLYFSDLFWAPYIVSMLGGPDTARIIHRVGASIMVFSSVYHVSTIIAGTVQKIKRGKFDYKRTQIPRLKDLYDFIADLKYFLGKEPYRPKMEKFMYKQKMHYLAILWGNTVLLTAGSALLFPEITSNLFPNMLMIIFPDGLVKIFSETLANFTALPTFIQDLARLMHVDEAIMALIVVAFWHWTNVHVVPGRFPLQWSFLTGKITREHQMEEHFLEYIRNLEEVPGEKEYLRDVLKENGFFVDDVKLDKSPLETTENILYPDPVEGV